MHFEPLTFVTRKNASVFSSSHWSSFNFRFNKLSRFEEDRNCCVSDGLMTGYSLKLNGRAYWIIHIIWIGHWPFARNWEKKNIVLKNSDRKYSTQTLKNIFEGKKYSFAIRNVCLANWPFKYVTEFFSFLSFYLRFVHQFSFSLLLYIQFDSISIAIHSLFLFILGDC